jgi:predicted nuclease of predicted toxin-antitoxin system
MRFLIDNNLSPLLAERLKAAGMTWCTSGTSACKLPPTASSLEHAQDENRVLISADTDFGSLLARSHSQSPSVVLIRRLIGRRAADQFEIIQANLPWVAEDLAAGAVVVIGDYRVRVRRLPLPG